MISIPTIQDLVDGIITDLETEFQVTLNPLQKKFLYAMASVQGAKLKQYYLAIGKLQKNFFADTAEREALGGTLERLGRIKLGRDPFPATQGEYEVEVTGTVGAVIPAQTTFKSDDSATSPGKLFILDADFTLTTSPDTMTLRALEAGGDSELIVGDTLTATAPLAGADEAAEVTTVTTEPQDEEDIEDYREKVLNSYRLEAQGGSAADYRLWGEDAQGVAAIYPYAKSGADNEIDVFVEATIADSTDGKGTPGGTILSEVEDVIEQDPDTTLALSERGRRPLGVFAVNVLAVDVLDVNITITGYQNSTAAKVALIEDALTELLEGIRPYIAGADVLDERNDTLDLNKITFAILNAVPGSVFTSVSMTVDGNSETSYQFDNGEIPFMNGVTFA